MNTKTAKFIFLAGAPKCGTTFLFNILKNHPSLNPSFPKETYYFCDKDHTGINPKRNYHLNKGVEAFYDYFDPEGSSYYLEATTHLIYQQEMFDVIKSLGEIKMVFLTRNPIDRITSTFNYTKYNLANIKNNKEYTLDNYVDHLLNDNLEPLKTWLRDERGYYVFKRELQYCKYQTYINQWKDKIGTENVKVYDLSELKVRQDEIVKEISQWLGLPNLQDEHLEEAKGKNSGYSVRNTWLHNKIVKLASYLPRNSIKAIIKSAYLGLQDNGTKDQLNKENRIRLYDMFNKEK